MKCLVFDIWGDFAHYRKFYTTSSPLTFSIPPRTAIVGMISAILGIDKDEYLRYFKKIDASIAIRILNPIKKTRISYNLIDTKTAKMMSKIQNRTQVTFEVLKDCKYRVYFTHKDNKIYNNFKNNLINHYSYYTPCMGLSELIANFDYIGEYEFDEKHQDDYININSVIPFDEKNIKVKFDEGKEYFKDTLPNEMSEDREVTEYIKVLYERNCKEVACIMDKFYESKDGEKIVFL